MNEIAFNNITMPVLSGCDLCAEATREEGGSNEAAKFIQKAEGR